MQRKMDTSRINKRVGESYPRRFSLPSGLKLSSAGEALLQIRGTPRQLSAVRESHVRMNRALVIASCMSEAEDFQRHLPHVKYPDVQFIYPPDVSSEVMPHDVLLSACREMINEEEVDILVCIHPHLTFVYASLLTQYPHLNGPSFESIFLCSHRYYCRRYITQGFTNNYSMVEMDNVTSSQISGILGDLSTPAVFMEAFNSTCKPLSMLVHTSKTVRRELEDIKSKVEDNLNLLRPLMAENIDEDRYDLAKESVCIFEEIRPHHRINMLESEDTGLYIVECCISDGEVIPWAISDINYWPDRPHCTKSVTAPTAIGISNQFEVWAVVREVLEKLIVFRFNNSFVNMTVQVNTDGSVRIHDIHPGFVHENIPLSRFVYQNGDTLRTHCDVSLNQEPHPLKMRPRHFAMKAYITLFSSGALKDLIDLKLLKAKKHVTLSVPDNVRIQILGKGPPPSRLSNPDTGRSLRSSLSTIYLENDRSRLATPETGRSRITTPDESKPDVSETTSEETNDTDNDHGFRTNSSDTLSAVDARISNRLETVSVVSRSPTPSPVFRQRMNSRPIESASFESRSPIPSIVTETDHVHDYAVGEDDSGCVLGSETEREELETEPVIIGDKDTGVCIGHMYVFGSTADDCTKQFVEFLRTVIKRTEECPWLI